MNNLKQGINKIQ